MGEILLEASGLGRTFQTRGGVVTALCGVDLELSRGDFLVLRGPSGAGKTTLLLALGGMSRPTTGVVSLAGKDLYSAGPRTRRLLRRTHVGFVFQSMHLVPYLDAAGNVDLGGRGGDWLERLGLSERTLHRPDQLSAGERQRVAVARALASGPDVILADEPTGNLDPKSAAAVIEALAAFRAGGGCVVMASHAKQVDVSCAREAQLLGGVLTE